MKRKDNRTADITSSSRRSSSRPENIDPGQISSNPKQKQHNRKLMYRNTQSDRLHSRQAEGQAGRLKFERPAQEGAAVNLLSETLAAAATSVSSASGSGETETDNPGIESGQFIGRNAEAILQQRLRHSRGRPPKHTSTGAQKKAGSGHISGQAKPAKTIRTAVQKQPGSQSSRLSRWHQKRSIRKGYALSRSGRVAARTKTSVSQTRKAGQTAALSGQRLLRFIVLHKKGVLIVLAIALLIVLLFAVFASCSQLALAGLGAVSMSMAFPVDDFAITAADLEMSRYETLLRNNIQQIETTLPGYDRYDYALASIGHDPFALAAYLATIHGMYTLDIVQSELEQLFQEMYRLTLTEKTEISRITDEDGNTRIVEIQILETSLVRNRWQDIISARLTDKQLEQYAFYLEILDSKQYFGSPFDFDWTQQIASHYGWRIHPIYKDMRIHRGLDVSVPTGTPIRSIHDGTVVLTSYGNTGFGNYIVIEDEAGYSSTYAHCQTLLVHTGQPVSRGEVIATAGSTGTSTGSHLHLELKYQGQYLNSIFLVQRVYITNQNRP